MLYCIKMPVSYVHTFAIYLLFITVIRIHCRTSIYSRDSGFYARKQVLL